MSKILGIDIGGSGIKGAIVDTQKGKLITERYALDTPQPATPKSVINTVDRLVKYFNWSGKIGCTFPAVIQHGIAHSAANIDKSWIEINVEQKIKEKTACQSIVLNDADAAGIAEMTFGAGKEHKNRLVIMLTLGTGIGCAIFINNKLVPNTEFGRVIMPNGKKAEWYASARIRTKENLTWLEWAGRLNEYLTYMEMLFSPDLFIIGGGISEEHHKFLSLITIKANIIPAYFKNQAGIIGAAIKTLDIL
jgi:polyphosphate glucokinase